MSDTYRQVTVEFVRTNPRSFIVKNTEGEEVVIGRSCVHGVDEPRVADAKRGEEVEFRVMEWLAAKESLL